jgi:hypothetical protein
MSKQTTTRWYIGAWVVSAVAFVLTAVLWNNAQGAVTSGLLFLGLVMTVAAIIALVTWIGALVKLGMQHAWGWFAAVLILHLVGVGIIGMVAYAVAGPEDTGEVVIRPTMT